MRDSTARVVSTHGCQLSLYGLFLLYVVVVPVADWHGCLAAVEKFEGAKSFESNHRLFNEEFLRSSNLASYLGVRMVESLHMGVPLSMVFVGFAGDGNQGLNITDALLATWFERLDHVLPHTRVSLTELTCGEDGHCSGMATMRQPPSPLRSYVHLNLSCHVVAVHSKAVLEQFERAIRVYSRPVDPAKETGPQQVDAYKMEEFVDNFVMSMGLATQYTIVVLNPRWTSSLPKYGYRTGFSEEELAMLHERRNTDRIMGVMRHFYDKEPVMQPAWGNSWVSSGHLFKTRDKFKVNDMYWSSEYWTKMAAEYLRREEDYRKALLKAVGEVPAPAAQAHAVRTLLHPESRPLSRILTDSLLMNIDPDSVNGRFRTMHPLEDCLVHLWVGNSRWLLLDLTAGGFDWGPALGGEGIVNQHSTPSVTDAFGPVQELEEVKASAKAETDEEKALREKLNTQKSSTLAATANRHYHAYMMHKEHSRSRQGAPGAPGTSPGASPGAPGGAPDEAQDQLSPSSLRRHQRFADSQSVHGIHPGDQAVWTRKHEELLAQAELDLLENFAHQHCSGIQGSAPVCAEAKQRSAELLHDIQTRQASSTANYNTKRDHNWDIFGVSASALDEGPELSAEKVRSRDLFLAQLSGVLSRAIRHVIVPPTATWSHRGYMHDTATPWARQVHFNVYLVSDSTRRLASPPRGGTFDSEALKNEVNTLKLPNQGFHWSVRSISLLSDPALSVSFAASLRTSVLELPTKATEQGTLDLSENEVTWLDSKELAYRLRQRFAEIAQPASRDLHERLDVPIFIFMLDRPFPIQLDKHYSARALEDMVLIVHNGNNEAMPSGMMCNGALLGRPLSAMKGALAAMLQHLGGLVPPHLGYSPLRKKVTHDWLWSVGANPLSMTCTGLKYAMLQRDALWRSYLLDAIDSSIDLVNQGVFMLKREVPEPHVAEHLNGAARKLRELQSDYRELVQHWNNMIISAYGLDFHSAMNGLPAMERQARHFLQLCQEVHSILHPIRCTPPPGWVRYVAGHPVLLASLGIMAGAVVLFISFRSIGRKRKTTKFN